jgi:hypothetical protein
LQALTVLNDAAFHETAVALAQRMHATAPSDPDAQFSLGYRLVASREITPDRIQELRNLHQELVTEYTNSPDTMNGIAKTPNEAALAVIASVLLNLDESMTR